MEYICPICAALQGLETSDTWIKQPDIFYKNETISAFIGSKFIKGNEGHPIIVPNVHYKDLYLLPDDIAAHCIAFSKVLSAALKEVRDCEGITIVQCNEPAGGQHAFHYHMHVIPRFTTDDLWNNMANARISEPSERTQYSEPLRKYFDSL